jgi:hypothetical protein
MEDFGRAQSSEFRDRPTIKANAKQDDTMNSAQRHESMREEMGVYFHVFITSALVKSEPPALRHCHFNW